jgi:hypothetical protein
MATRRTVDLLPEIFRTSTNRQFLGATLDQLTQEPVIKRTQGYVGRRVGPGVNPADNYVVEPTASRTNYQLEPAVAFLKPQTNTIRDAITYPGIIDALALKGADISRQDRLFESQYYSWDPFCDFDKFTNYSQYYWLAQGPNSVDISGTAIPLTDSWEITRNETSYTFSDVEGSNPTITLVRGGNYEFTVNQPGYNFWIQAASGVNGRMPATPNISSRDVLGVENNGEEQGTITFNVPLKTAQDFYYNLPNIGTVDLVTDLLFSQINNVYVSEFFNQYPLGIDGITNLDGRTVIFTNPIVDATDGGWFVTTQYDPLLRDSANNGLPGSYDSLPYDQTTYITSQSQRYSIWRISYVYDSDDQPYMQLSSIQSVANLTKFSINFGTVYATTQWYKNASGYFEEIPLLTAVLDTLYYQDSVNPELFGRIKIVDQSQELIIDANEIIGATNYTSPNGVVFTNGLKVQFRGLVEPAQFQDLEYYVEGVGTGPGIDARVGFIDGEAYFGAFHVYNGQKMTGQVHSTTTFQQYIYDTIEESLLNVGAGGPAGAALPTTAVVGAMVGNGIKLLPVGDFVTPETYTKSATIPYDSTSYDSQPYDSSLNAPEVQDYITINRASKDRNAWTRSNRWFHVDVIRATAEYNNQDIFVDNNLRAKRPIIEFRANVNLFNFGTQGKQPVNIVDFASTDALSNINGQPGYSTDGYTFINGSRVIFAADSDPAVRNTIYEVEFIDPANTGNFVIDLVPAVNGTSLINQTVVCLSGNVQQGKSYWFDGSQWILAQQKININQPPLFDVYDSNGISFGDRLVYPSSTFVGSKLFGYAVGTATVIDPYLGFRLRYLNINNVGDIVFENYLYVDTFLYVEDNISQTLSISNGFVRQYFDRVSFGNFIGWQSAIQENRSRQLFKFIYTGAPLQLDIAIDNSTIVAPLQLYIEGIFVNPSDYVYDIGTNTTTITILNTAIPSGTIIEVDAISNQSSTVGFYEVPLNLENNPLNENSNTFTLGTIRTHYESIGQNIRTIQGPIIGANNTRDLGNIIRYGNIIVQQSAPLALTSVFLRENQFELFNSIEFNSREYAKYKAYLLDLISKGDFENSTPTQILDDVLQQISLGRSNISPFYWSDMITAGETFSERTVTYTPISTATFDTAQTYDFTSSNFQGLSVFVNGRLLTRNYEFVVSPDTPTFTITIPLFVGDVITIREYATTFGSYVPNTPTKLGLYPLFKPEIYVDNSYITPTTVIRGHDGSITVAFRDVRDQVLLEFETRIFNNIKIVSPIPLSFADVVPGQFRTTEYTLAEVNQILGTDFLSWVGWNKLDYTTQTYLPNNPFTYNYSQSSNRLNGEPLLGAWRGIYNYFYDTYTPNTTPWEMLGISQKPVWWEAEYGPAPYTSGNTVLWDDLSIGLIKDPINPQIDERYARPQLSRVIPVGSEGELLDPLSAVVGNYDATSFRQSWTFGDNGPVENTWRTSSAWPFAVMRLLALTKPAKFFSLFADRDRYVYNDALGQYLWDDRYRLDASKLTPLYGNGTSKASYLDWIIDYNRQLGINSTTNLTDTLSNIDVRLAWRMAAFGDKKYLKVYTERSTPDSLNTSLLLPDESYQLLLYKNQPFNEITYSSVIVQKTDTGYAVLGYSTLNPYFEILVSRSGSTSVVISAGGQDVRVSTDHTNLVSRVPYGFVFTNVNSVCDFLVSYGVLLENQGFIFDNRENGYALTWLQMAEEFLYWSKQGWAEGSIINLNPAATSISVDQPLSVVDNLNVYSPENIVLNQNRQPLKPSDLIIDRIDNLFTIRSLTSNTINFLNLRFTAYEHLLILDNRSIFADLIYQPVTGARQSRVLVSGNLSGDWNGTVNAPGFVLNQDNIVEWVPTQKYAKGEIVLFKDEYWTASTIIQPGQSFNYSLWVKSDYDQVQKGLLPNASNASDQLATSYSVYDANLEQEVDLFSYGLIGFRPREYMQALNLDDVSQVNLYQQFLGSKGTIQAAELFTFADLGKEVAEYDIDEYWAILRSTYGATANRSYFELLLDQAYLQSNPSLIQVIQPGQQSEADQVVLVENIWKSSTNITSPNILPTTLITPTDQALPMAGYVNLDDVDVTLFDFDAAFNNPTVLADIGINTNVWVAKINSYDWGVFKSELVPGNITTVSDNLNGLALVQFSKQHGLIAGDILIIKYFNDSINGIYRVQSVPDLQSLLISYTFTGFQTSITGTGLGLTLQTSRVVQASDIVNLPYALDLRAGARVWVDNNGQGQWEVLEKTDPFIGQVSVAPFTPEQNSLYGSSVAQGFQNLSALVGAPGYNFSSAATAPGAVYTYVRTQEDVYAENSILQLGTTDAAGYGNAADIGDQQWAIIGASASDNNYGYAAVVYRNPASNVFQQWQLLVRDTGDIATVSDEFGYSVAISQDERWIYVGAPGGNRVYTYGRVDVPQQSVRYVADGTTPYFNYSDSIIINTGNQISVAVNNTTLTYGVDWDIVGNDIALSTTPTAGSLVAIARRSTETFVGDNIEDTFSLSAVYSAVNEYAVSVYINSALQRPFIDYTIDGSQNLIFASPPATNAEISIRAETYYTPIDTLTIAGLGGNERFGASVATSTDGRQVIVGCPLISYTDPVTSITYPNAGALYVFDRSIQRFQIVDADALAYTTEQNLVAPTQVVLNGVFLTNIADYTNGTYSISGNTITLEDNPAVGDILEIETNEFSLIQTIRANEPSTSARFGYATDLCTNNCSSYTGAPYAHVGTDVLEAGQVDYNVNQSRVFGSITSTVANPTLTAGNFIRINNYFVELTGTTVEQLVADITAANLPNIQATSTRDVELLGDSSTRVFDIGSVYSAASSYTTLVLINDVQQTSGVDYNYNNSTQQITFTTAPAFGTTITVVSGRLTISAINIVAAPLSGKLEVAPGTGTVFADLGLDTYVYQQTIESPVPQAFAHFGQSLFISDNATALMIGAPNGSQISFMTFDNGITTFDVNSMDFYDITPQSGVVYSYDALMPAVWSLTNPRRFVFGQQIINQDSQTLDQFGTSIDYTTGTLLIGSPGVDFNDSQANYGHITELRNVNNLPAWQVTRLQQPTVEIALLNTVFMYDRASGLPKQYFDYFNPSQGRLLGAVAQNINYIGSVDPAAYNTGDVNNYGSHWSQERVGQIWWNTFNARFIDTNQDDVVYASRRWGELFPGSTVDVYQWVESSVPPANYAGPGTVWSTTSYTTSGSLNEQGVIGIIYYFWVTGINTVATAAKKTLSTVTIARYIESPKSSGISYIAPINASTIAIYNGESYISAQDTVLHIEYDQQLNDAAVHVEYQLVAQDRAGDFLSDALYNKLQDSFCGVDITGRPVPDPFLTPSEQYGVQARPRQSMFVNRFLALRNYLGRVNTILAQYPIVETRRLTLLNSEEPEPTASSGAWDKRVVNYEELTYQNLNEVPIGYLYLVASDSNYRGLWTIYQVVNGNFFGEKTLLLVRVQNYDTKQYWNHIDWYQPNYNPLTRIYTEVINYSALDTITVPDGSSVKVTSNAQGKWEIYVYNAAADSWTRVALQDGTVQIDSKLWDYTASDARYGFDVEVFDAQFFDQEPVIETRKVIQAINQELLIDDLLIERNRALILMFNYILSEQQAPYWLTKTSLIDVNHVIRELLPYQIYRQDNQDFVLNYIQEVKPYHVQIRQFNLIYNGSDTYLGTVNDFDLPAYWDPAQELYISPVLDNTGTLSTTSSVPSTSERWQTLPWNQWYQNYLLEIESVIVNDGGSGYTIPPEVVVSGSSITPAVMIARVNSAGVVVSIDVIDSGSGYSTTADITLVGGNGTGAYASAVMGNSLVRSIITTIKFDRYQYSSNIVEWQPNVSYTAETLVRYVDVVWEANDDVTSSTFDPEQWTFVPADTLSGVDRTMGYYVPEATEPGLDLALLISGVDYPGVQVDAPDFNQNTGFDVGNYDINPYDNLSYGPEGRPTYDPAILDAIYQSDFTDPYLGTLPAPAYNGLPPTTGPNPIIVDGGAFVDAYSSHAPEELVPGAMFDTLDMRVFTTPGADWEGGGHGFPIASKRYQYTTTSNEFNFSGLLDYPVVIQVWDQTAGLNLIPVLDYSVDWVNYTITVNNTVAQNNDTIVVYAYALGGGNQIYVDSFVGNDVGNAVVIPVQFSLINELAIFVNGELLTQNTDYTFASSSTYFTRVAFTNTYGATDLITITAMGFQSPQYSWSVPLTQYFVADGSTLTFTLANSLEGTNPANVIVEKNGIRARPSASVEYINDESSLQYYCPEQVGYSPALVAGNDVSVYIDNVPQTLGVDFVVDTWNGISTARSITLTTMPPADAVILISVRTEAQYSITGNTLVWSTSGSLNLIAGDIVSVTTWNDTSQQDILTQVFVGPTTQGLLISEPYDSTLFDEASISGTAGSYDYSTGTQVLTNRFDTGRIITDSTRIEVTLDGLYQFLGTDFTIDGTAIIISGPAINAAQIVTITSFTQSAVPGAIAFRIFQDMRGLQTTYRITQQTTTVLVAPLSTADDIIYVQDAGALSQPNLPLGIFGLITINGERIAYRYRDTANNTVSGLRRGTAGTGAANHTSGSYVYDIGSGNQLPREYQNYVVSQNFLANGTDTVFVATDISVEGVDSTELQDAVEVFVGGIKQTSGYTIDLASPVTIRFDTAPTENYQITILVKRGLSWYEPGPGTPSNGIALQEQNTLAARFIRGE